MERAKIVTNKLRIDVECPYCYELNIFEIDSISETIVEKCDLCEKEFYIVADRKFG